MATLDDGNDGFFSSRKLIFSFYATVLIAGMWACTSKFPGLAAQFPTAIGGILAVLAGYIGGNVGHHYILNKFNVPDMSDPDAVADQAAKAAVPAAAATPVAAKPVVAPAEIGSLTITKGSPADADGEPTEEASE